MQLSALFLGVWIVYHERPMLQVLSDDGVYVYSHKDLEGYEYEIPRFLVGSPPYSLYLDLPPERSASSVFKVTSELKSGTPYTLDKGIQKPFGVDDTDANTVKRLLGDKDLASNCYLVEIFSSHYNGNGCFDENYGINRLIR